MGKHYSKGMLSMVLALHQDGYTEGEIARKLDLTSEEVSAMVRDYRDMDSVIDPAWDNDDDLSGFY